MPREPLVGLHVSSAGSLDLAFDRALEIGCTAFQMFTRNPRTWKFKPLTDELISSFREKRRGTGFKSIIAHMPYLPNLASPNKPIMKVSRYTLSEEVSRCDALGIDYLVTHLGSHMGKGTVVGIRNVAEACNEALSKSSGGTKILLENMAGQKNCVGARFEELGRIIDLVEKKFRVGVCLDSCHAFAAGFDLSNDGGVERSMEVFDDSVGYGRLSVLHLNDSKGVMGSNLDRHEYIGKGKIGIRGMAAVVNYPGMSERPIIMETPFDNMRAMKASLATVRRLIGKPQSR